MINFLAEIALRYTKIIYPSPSGSGAGPGGEINRTKNIYEIDISTPPTDSYWSTVWGGWYDEYTGTQIELYYGQFLQHVNNMAELLSTNFSLFIDTAVYRVYFNIPVHPWLYPDYANEGENVIPFISSALDGDNPSNNYVRGVPAETRLEIPSFTVKLSDTISGITLNQGFSVDLRNNDGYFDDDALWDLFNTPVHLKKAIVENPAYEDFKEIRGGYAGSTKTTFENFSIDVEDKLRSMSEPVCDVIQQANFPSITLIADAVGKNIPVVYGVKKIKPVKLNQNIYMSAEGALSVSDLLDKDGAVIPFIFSQSTGIITYNYSAVTGVFDKNGTAIPYTNTGGVITTNVPNAGVDYITVTGGISLKCKHDTATGIITYNDADTVLISGYAANTAGEIIKDLITRKTSLQYNASNWNTDEVAAYIAIAPRVNIVFASGDIKKAVQDVLKSDMAYFIQQTGGRFTIRRWGEVYGSHEIPSWAVTQRPEKNYDKAQENYFSSCTVKYNFSETDQNTFDICLYNDEETAAEDRYRKKHFSEYETDLITEADARALAVLLGGRYTTMRQRVKLAVGVDTVPMELLDTVTFNAEINGRNFSAAGKFVITEINPAQDILSLEEITD